MPLFLPPVPPAGIVDDIVALTGAVASVLAASTVYLRAFTLQAPTVIVATGFRNGATTTGKTNIGIYTLAGNLVPGSDTGQITNVANNDNKFTYATPVMLAPGQYFIALSPSNSTDNYMSRSSAVATSNSSYRTATNILAAGALPATTGAINITSLEPLSTLYTQGGLV